VLVQWGDRPSEQVGGWATEIEAQQWIKDSSVYWLKSRFEWEPRD
jgi:hypothetical protein